MKAAELAATLRGWFHEYRDISGDTSSPNDKAWMFIANRLAEFNLAEPDPDIVTIKKFDGHAKVRINGTRGQHLTYESCDGSIGMGLVLMQDVIESDRGKLDGILERLVQQGKVKG